MKLTELFTPEQCREAMELLGGTVTVEGWDLVGNCYSTREAAEAWIAKETSDG